MNVATWWVHLSCSHCALLLAVPLTVWALMGSHAKSKRNRRVALHRRLNSTYFRQITDAHYRARK